LTRSPAKLEVLFCQDTVAQYETVARTEQASREDPIGEYAGGLPDPGLHPRVEVGILELQARFTPHGTSDVQERWVDSPMYEAGRPPFKRSIFFGSPT
jgi:hypothetical protein